MNTQEQHEIYEKARQNIRQKKKVYNHFIIFLLGTSLLIVFNKFFNLGTEKWGDWFKWIVTIWFFLWWYHVIRVFIINRFFGQEWERSETEKLIAQHQEKIKKLEEKLVENNTIASPEDEITS